MIRSFADLDAERLFCTGAGAGDLTRPPSNRLEALSGEREGEWSIRINDQWRLCFRFEDGDASDVEIVGDH